MSFLSVLLTKVILATTLAAFAEVVRRRATRPGTAYALWASVLAVLIIPSFFSVSVPDQMLIPLRAAANGMADWYAADVEAESLGSRASESVEAPGVATDTLVKIVVVCWLVGCLILFHRRLLIVGRIRKLVGLASETPAEFNEQCSRLSCELRMNRVPRVVMTGGTFSPFLWDPIRGEASIVMPAALLRRISKVSLDAILRHELIHVRRRDAWRNRLVFLISTLWWWFPTAVMARRRLLVLEELCTDAEVIRENPQRAKEYAHALLDTDEFLAAGSRADLSVVPAFTQGNFLRERIVRIVAEPPRRSSGHSRSIVYLVAAASLALGVTAAGVPERGANGLIADVSSPTPTMHDVESVDVSEPQSLSASMLPDSDVVSVRRTDREIVLVWPRTASAENLMPVARPDIESEGRATRSVRLVRVSEDGMEPRVWKIDRSAADGSPLKRSEVDWLFGFLALNNVIVDCDGTKHQHPGRTTNVV